MRRRFWLSSGDLRIVFMTGWWEDARSLNGAYEVASLELRMASRGQDHDRAVSRLLCPNWTGSTVRSMNAVKLEAK